MYKVLVVSYGGDEDDVSFLVLEFFYGVYLDGGELRYEFKGLKGIRGISFVLEGFSFKGVWRSYGGVSECFDRGR